MSNERAIQSVPISLIKPSPFQNRDSIESEPLQKLIASIREIGLSSPILLRPEPSRAGDSGTPSVSYWLVSGQRRLEAVKQLGWTEIPAFIEEMTEEQAAIRGIAENEVREGTTVIEKAHGLKRLLEPPLNFSQARAAASIGLADNAMVSRLIALLSQPEEIQTLLGKGELNEGHIRSLNRIQGAARRTELAKRVAKKGWTVRQTEQHVKRLLERAKESKKAEDGPKGALESDVNGFRITRNGNVLALSGRDFRLDRDTLDSYLADLRAAFEVAVRDLCSDVPTPQLPDENEVAKAIAQAAADTSAITHRVESTPQAASENAGQTGAASDPPQEAWLRKLADTTQELKKWEEDARKGLVDPMSFLQFLKPSK